MVTLADIAYDEDICHYICENKHTFYGGVSERVEYHAEAARVNL
jgi:hypothetical protein